MKVIITGAEGQLGLDLVAACSAAGDDVIAAGRVSLDITDRGLVLGTIGELEPDVVVHAAAWTAVDACEDAPERAYQVNAMGCRHVAEGCRRVGAHLVAVSTDYVFDGTKWDPYTEWDEPNPLSVYGRSKLGGEREVLHGCPGATVVRTSWVSGAGGANMVKTILRLASDPDRDLAFVDDQFGRPTFTADLAPVLRTLAVARAPGIYHAANQGVTTWHAFAQDVLEAAGLDRSRVRAIATAELDPPRAASRPFRAVLDDLALRAGGFELLPDHHASLQRLVKELL